MKPPTRSKATGPGPKSLSRAKIPPRYWRDELETILISRSQIRQRVGELAQRIQSDYSKRDLVIVAVLNGTIMFLSDLIRHMRLPMRLDFIGVSSYGSGTTSGELIFTKQLKLDVRGRDVLLIDDILDTGRTLKCVSETLCELKPASLHSCVLLDKKARRVETIEADYVGFRIPDRFVVGYGLDYAERYRNLPFIAVLQKHVYRS